MTIHLRKEIEKTEKRILELSAYCEEALRKSVRAFVEHNKALAQEVIDEDALIDTIELEVEEECLKVLALHQPVASDLRFIVAALRINADLERIGDHATSISQRAISLSDVPHVNVNREHLQQMMDLTIQLLQDSIDSLIRRSTEKARSVLANEEKISSLKNLFFSDFIERSKADPINLECYTQHLLVSRYLERVADHAFNISEDLIYMVEGHIVRHQ